MPIIVNSNHVIVNSKEGSHRGLVRPPAKRLGGESPLMGSNPIPSAIDRDEKHQSNRQIDLIPHLDHRVPDE